jgi:pantetheine-phosphate adenylyltransferase
LDIIGRAARLFDEVIVAVGANVSKNALFTVAERIELLELCNSWDNVRIVSFSGLLTQWCVDHDVQAIVKGLRAAGDFEYERPMADMNTHLAPAVDTVFLAANASYAAVSSSLIKEVAGLGGDVSAFVPGQVEQRLMARLAERRLAQPD